MRRKHIESDRWYSLLEVVNLGLFPWCKTVSSARRIIGEDKKKDNVLKANIIGEGKSKRYHIQGKNISKFISKFAGK